MLSVRCLSVCPVCDVGVLWPNGWMDEDETWHAGRTRPWQHCVRWGHTSPPPKGHSPIEFSAYICCGQMAGWIKMPLGMEVGLGPGDFVFDGTQLPPEKRHTHPAQFLSPCPLWPNGWIDDALGTEVDLGPGHIVLASSRERGITAPLFSAHVCCGTCGHGRPSQLLLSSCSCLSWQLCHLNVVILPVNRPVKSR